MSTNKNKNSYDKLIESLITLHKEYQAGCVEAKIKFRFNVKYFVKFSVSNDEKELQGNNELLELLETAKNALRSYQYHNASPDLAKEVADKIESVIKEE
jgi:hypothetical protein